MLPDAHRSELPDACQLSRVDYRGGYPGLHGRALCRRLSAAAGDGLTGE
jgi:hypothetical protein